MLSLPVLAAPVARSLVRSSSSSEGVDQSRLQLPGNPSEGVDQSYTVPINGVFNPSEGVDQSIYGYGIPSEGADQSFAVAALPSEGVDQSLV